MVLLMTAGDTVTLTEGELTLNADGSYSFTPNDNFNGAVPVITYTVTDGAGDTDTSTLTINVTPVSDLTDNNEVVTVAEDTPATGNVLDNAATADGPLTVTSFTVDGNTYSAGDTVTLAEGELTLNTDGSYTFTPNDNFNGAVPVITYTVTDGAGDTQSSTLTISVTPVSDLRDDSETVTIAEDTTASGNVLDNAETADGPLTVTSFTVNGNTYSAGDTVTLTEGELTLNADGSYTFTPNDNFNGTVPVITYTVTDGAGDTTESTLTINVTPVSDLTDNNEVVTIAEDTPATGNVLDNAATADGPLTVTSFTVGTTTYAAGDTVTLAEGELTLNADGSYSFTPNDNFNGAVPVITYTVTDGAGDTTESTLTINVTPVSDLTDSNEVVTIAEDTTATGNVLDNAETADGPLTVTSFTVNGDTYSPGDTVTLTEGELTLNADGSYTFTPNDNFNGTVPAISYTVTDGAGDTTDSSLTINVTPVSDLSDNNETVTVAEDTPATGNVLDNAATADGPLTVTSFTVDGNTYTAGDTVTLTEGELTLNADGSYSFTPNDNFNGAVPVITYTVTDGAGDTTESTLTINVTPVSDLSDNNETVTVAEDTPATGNVLDNAATADGPLTVTSFTVGTTTYAAGDTVTLTEGELTLNVDGSYSFTPNDNFNGSVPAITYTVTDGAGDTTESTLTINVTPVSDLSDNNETVTVAEDTPATGNVLDNATTADGPLSVTSFTVAGNTYAAGDTVTLAEGELTLNADGTYSFTPNDNFNGTVSVITYTVTDGAGDTTESTLTINVTPVSDLTDNNEVVTIAEDTPATGNVLDNAATADGPLSVTSFTVDGNTYTAGDTVTLAEGDLTLNADGSYRFTPNDNFNGTVPAITYTVTDGAGDTDTSTLTINVTPVSDLVAADDNFNVDEGSSVTGNIIIHNDGDGLVDTDGGDGSTLFVTQVNGVNLVFAADGFAIVTVEGGTLRINANGDFTYQNSEGYVLGADYPNFEYTLSDGINSDIATVTISVNDSAPLAVDDFNTVIYKEIRGVTSSYAIGGNVIDDGSSGDNQDSSVDGTVTLIQFEYNGIVYVFNVANTSYTINTGFGTFVMDNTGQYSFNLPFGTDASMVPSAMEIIYTIQDGDSANPETDTATLTISLSNETNSVVSSDTNDELIDIYYDQESIALNANHKYNNPEIEYDLSDLLVENNSNDLNENFMPNELVEGDASNLEPPLEVVTAPTDDNLILASVDPVDGSSATETIITNNFLAEGVTLNSDASSEVVPLPIELDSTDQI